MVGRPCSVSGAPSNTMRFALWPTLIRPRWLGRPNTSATSVVMDARAWSNDKPRACAMPGVAQQPCDQHNHTTPTERGTRKRQF